MDKYYYLAAQLPVLEFDTEPGIGSEAFLAEADKWLSPADLAVLRSVDLAAVSPAPSDPAPLLAYKRHELRLRSELAEWRKARREGQEFKPSLFSAATLLDNHPLAAEKELLRKRWDLIEDSLFGHYSDLEFLVLYLLKLQILERLLEFDLETGRQKFRSYTETVA